VARQRPRADLSSRFADLDYEGFRELARDPSLSPHEKVGFPDSYREGFERRILRDIVGKLTRLRGRHRRVLDIGPGCSGVAQGLIELCQRRGHRLWLVDSPEMLALLPDAAGVGKHPGRFPQDCGELITAEQGTLDAILVYSVLQYVFAEGDVFAFVDSCLQLLAPGGQLLLGDLPNQSMRQRFLSSPAGVRFLRRVPRAGVRQTTTDPVIEHHRLDDAVVVSLLLRARAAGFHAFVVPQGRGLPMADRREDVLMVRP
jgi:hypothetical protein